MFFVASVSVAVDIIVDNDLQSTMKSNFCLFVCSGVPGLHWTAIMAPFPAEVKSALGNG